MKQLLIHKPEQLSDVLASAAARDLYSTMEKMRRAALEHSSPWADYPTLQDYAQICFWAIRKMEYGFAADQFTLIEGDIKHPLKVLDVGCGVVPLNNWIAKRGHEVIALDPLHEDISFLVKNNMNQFYGTNVTYLTAAGEGLPFPDQYFDIVTSISVLEHTIPGNDRVILDEIARVLKPTGHLLISFDVSPLRSLQEGENRLPDENRYYPYPFHPQAVRRLFTWLSRYFDVPINNIPSALDELTWNQVYSFWQEMQDHDRRESATREYLALCTAISRNGFSFQEKTEEVLQAYMEGQAALGQQLSFYRHHANHRLEAIESLQANKMAQEKVQEALHKDLTKLHQDLEKLHQDLENERRELIEKEDIIQGFRSSYFFWIVNGPLRWLPGLRSYTGLLRAFRRFFLPKVGVLDQHPPRSLFIPNTYLTKPKAPASRLLPSISIVTPSYNQGEFIERTIRSVLSQEYPNLEYIVQDGDSKDDTLKVLQLFQQQLTSIDSRRDNGQAHAINMGFQRASGEIMAYLNSDDILLPGSLRYVADYFTRNADVDVIYSHRVIIDEKDQEIGRWILPPHDNDIILWADYIPQETMFWRRSLWEKTGGYLDESYRFALDWDLILRFRTAGAKFQRVPRFLGAFRLQAGQKTSMQIRTLGLSEMNRLRSQIHGREVSPEEINDNIMPYLKRALSYHRLYRLGILRH
jgi:glycosyltransferase involved in cell wall biosynthesis/SAM-dependent methyltransferase